jgi:hypothetical protein
MKSRRITLALLCWSAASAWIRAQGADPSLLKEAAAVRAEIGRSVAALRQYAWTEQTEVLVGGSVKSSDTFACRYDASGKLLRMLLDTGKQLEGGRSTSNRPSVRGKADLRDYIERSVTRIHEYAPPRPELIDHALLNGQASLGPVADGRSEIRLTYYYLAGDSYVFTYDSRSKLLLRATVRSILGSAKDPVTMEATFETLPDGVNHIGSAILTAKKRSVQVRMRNVGYYKLTQ